MPPPYDNEAEASDSSDSEIDEEVMVEGEDGPKAVEPLPRESDSHGEKMESEDPYGLSEEELHAFSEQDTPMERSMKQKKQRHKDKFKTW